MRVIRMIITRVARLRWLYCGMVLILVAIVLGSQAQAANNNANVRFEEHVLPILKAHCFRCHAGADPRQGLRLMTAQDLLRGGESGPAIRIAAAESSLLWEKLASDEMPKDGPPLSAEEKGIIRSWINEGAAAELVNESTGEVEADPADGPTEYWSFRPPVRPPLPSIRDTQRAQSPIDFFLIAALESKGLGLSPEASREVLMRRLYYTLIGLPPTPAEMQAFIHDPDEHAYEKMVERLLASPHYGERWARHWLDVAGYADSAGVLAEDRPLPTAYRYRDYVIRSLNADKPYDRFLQEQIAGDELSDYWTAYETQEQLPAHVIEAVTATGFLRCAPDASRPDFATIKNADALYFYPTLYDTLQIVSSATMGLTIQCARCHDHKFDPIPQVEYYRMQAIFMGALRPRQWIPQMERSIPVASAAQKKAAEEHNAKLDAEIARLNTDFANERGRYKQRLLDERLQTLPEPIREDVRLALTKAADQRSAVEQYLIEKFQKLLAPDDNTIDQVLSETYTEYQAALSKHNAQIAAHQQQRITFDELRALYDLPGSATTPLLRRGDALVPGPPVEPGVLSTLAVPIAFQWTPPAPEAKTSGRRLAFARWLTQPDHPLTARVMVNRIWLHHFGEGLVATPEDFGTMGASPSHPELLDWLARDFVENGWSMKHVHRLILNSAAFRQRSDVDVALHTEAMQVDPDNRLLWRQRMRRVEAEPLRDAMLTTTGLLDTQMYGSAVPLARQSDGEVTIADAARDRRRSIYLQVLRSNPLTLLHAYDQPVMETNCIRRTRSTVSTQALTLLNSDSVVRYATALADRALREAPDTPGRFAIMCTFARSVSADEQLAVDQFLVEQQNRYVSRGEVAEAAQRLALVDLCHMLLAANEFVYID